MDSNNINKILGFKNLSEDIYYEENNKDKPKRENEHEDRLRLIANIILIAGVISAVILFFSTALVTIKGSNSWEDETIFSWAGFATVITTLLYSVGGWAFLNVISNISISLKEIKGSK